MTKKMSVAKTKEKMTQVFNQAKESLKLFENFEKETIAKAKTFVKIPISGNPKTITNDKILASLKKIGVSTQSELDSLRLRIEKLEGEIASMKAEERVGPKLPLT
jgi:polyhydroxyalkanoate synthesis regulator phasin